MAAQDSFSWCDPGTLRDDDLELHLVKRAPADPSRGYVPAYHFEMRQTGRAERIGTVDVRIGEVPGLRLYGGHIGYGVEEAFRGNRYAARACCLVLPLARGHGMTELWITSDPDNAASRRTAELAGGVYVGTVDIPEDHEMYRSGRRKSCRYRIDLRVGPREPARRASLD